MFKHKFTSLGYDTLERVTTDKGRYYLTPQGKKYPSITTILSKKSKDGLKAWRDRVGDRQADKISKQASNRGTKVHNLIEDYIWNKDVKAPNPWVHSSFLKVKELLDCNLGDILGIEKYLYSDRLGVAGTVDCVGFWNNRLSIIDWKTSDKIKLEKYIINYYKQAAFYALAWEELTGVVIRQLVIVIITDDLPFPSVFTVESSDWLNKCICEIAEYKRTKDALQHDMGLMFKGR